VNTAKENNVTSRSLGRLEQVDLRTIWTTEDRHFTPWLSEEDNLALLGDTIGMELILEGTEQSVGPFSADILCKNSADDSWVLIENQLERTDHTHLGQLLTYAAGLNAVTIVWISSRMTDEHRAALDWLNEITATGFNFFGLEIECWQIGDSIIAPKFNMVSKPNEWSRVVSRNTTQRSRSELSDNQKLQLDFWTGFRTHIDENNVPFKVGKPQPITYMNAGIGRSGFTIVPVISRWNNVDNTYDTNEIRVELYLDGINAKAHYQGLVDQKESIGQGLGKDLTWFNDPELKSCKIFVRKAPVDLDNRDNWQAYYEWISGEATDFYNYFKPVVSSLEP
tara:strand:+ start:297 stop:1307 length:1011 start_codon:yes stop_codon:yes gene_type:complete